MLESRAFKLAKDPEHPDENQDAFGVDAERGLAAIADGVASAIFSRQWAAILTDAVLDDTPDPRDKEAFAKWLDQCRQTWNQQIDVSGLAWFQKAKLRQGAFSTLLWISLTPPNAEQHPAAPNSYRLAGYAIGDSCLFHVRRGELLRTFPITSAAEMDDNPLVVGSMDLNRDELLEFQSLEADYLPDDLLVLCTDAIAQWALQRYERGEPVNWSPYWDMAEEDWRREVTALRAQREMRYDDATLLLLRLAEQPEPVTVEMAEPITAAVTEPTEPESNVAPPSEPAAPAEEDWKKKLKTFSDQFDDRFSTQVSRGLEKIKEAAESAEKAIKKYRDKWRSGD